LSWEGWIFSKTGRKRAEKEVIKEALENPQLAGVISASELLKAQIYPLRLYAKNHIEKRLIAGWVILNDNVKNARVRELWKKLKAGYEIIVVEKARGYLGFCLFNKFLFGHELNLASLEGFDKILYIRFLGFEDQMLVLFWNGDKIKGIEQITSRIMEL